MDVDHAKQIVDLSIRKEEILKERKLLLQTYGYFPKVNNANDQFVKAFQKLADLSINAWPRESADKQAEKDYKWFINSELEYSGINQEIKEVSLQLSGR